MLHRFLNLILFLLSHRAPPKTVFVFSLQKWVLFSFNATFTVVCMMVWDNAPSSKKFPKAAFWANDSHWRIASFGMNWAAWRIWGHQMEMHHFMICKVLLTELTCEQNSFTFFTWTWPFGIGNEWNLSLTFN